MIDYDDIKREIKKLENSKMTYPILERLSVLYSVYNQQFFDTEAVPSYSMSFATAPSSEFLQAVQSSPIERTLSVLDEHMEAIKVLYPKEYDLILSKIKAPV